MKLFLSHKFSAQFFFFILGIILLTVLIFWPGLSGSFMLDDYSSLPFLFENIDGCGFTCAVLSGSTGPTGRPLSLITFAWQVGAWPDAYWFKVVNLLIHLLNSCLLFCIFHVALKRINPSLPSFYIALCAAFLWAVWPIQVSSVLYVIQRMVLLSSFFVLSGILFYFYCRLRLEKEWKGQFTKWLLMCIGLAVLGVSAIYSKESGVLLLVYICVIEGLFFQKNRTEKSHELSPNNQVDKYVNIFRWGCLAFPLSGFVLYILIKYIGQADFLYMTREFTLEERLMTQGRILLDYMHSLLLPRASDLGLYHDSYVISKSLFQPVSTLFSWLFIISLLCVAWFFRKKNILLASGIFWFFGGHLLESTIVSLELYFEHRNYLPISFLTLLFVYACYQILIKSSRSIVRYVFSAILVCYFLMIIMITFSQARLWGNEIEYGVVQANEHSDSVRARTLLVDIYNQSGQVDLAYDEMLKMQKEFPNIAGLIVGNVEFACFDEKYPLLPLEEIVPKLEQAKYGYGAMVTISETLREINEGTCKVVSPEYLLALNSALKRNPPYARKMHILLNNEASALMMLNRLEEAVETFSTMNLKPQHWPHYISLLATLGRLEEALKVSNSAIEDLKTQWRYAYYYDDVVRLKGVIEQDLNVK